jgi:Na+-transporting NADH:ubiquinone oxidoreductase subunit C
MNKQSTVYTIIFIFIVSFVFVFLLSMTNQVTIEQVQLNQELARKRAVLTAMGIEAKAEEQILEEFEQIREDVSEGLYVATIDGRKVYASSFAGAGLWGTISGILAVNDDFTEIVGLEIVDDNETPGLGGRINEEWFKQQFAGENIEAGGVEVRQLEGEGDEDKSNALVDAITGATRTSESVETIVNNELQYLQSDEVRNRLQELSTEGGET